MAIYPTINSKIETILNGVVKIKAVYPYPVVGINAYPAAIFYPATVSNSFETVSDNMKVYGYKLWIVLNVEATNIQNGYEVLARVMDTVIEAFDDGWDLTTIDGHRAWLQIDTGSWALNEEMNGLELAAEIDLSIKTLTTNN